MIYEIKKDPYLDPKTGILRNLFDISNQSVLDQVEAEITVSIIATIDEQPIAGDFDLKHLMAIHYQLFSGIYSWAGKLRTVDMTKDETRFAPVEFLEQSAAVLFNELRVEKYLDELDGEIYLKRFAYYYSEINILHPFREGNGRTQRVFFSMLARRSGYHLAWDLMDSKENIVASEMAYRGDDGRLISSLRPLFIKNDN